MPRPHPRARRPALLLALAAGVALTGPAPTASSEVSTPGAAIALQGSSTASSTSATSVVVDRPAGAVAGDVLVARVANRDRVTADVTADGWTEVGSAHSASRLKSVVLTRVATGAEPSSYRFDVDQASNLAVSISAFANVDLADPVDSYTGRVNGNSAALDTPPVTAGVGNAVAVWFGTQVYGSAPCSSATLRPPSDFLEVVDDCLPGTQAGLTFDTAYRQLGAASTRSGWSGASTLPETNIAQVVTLRPAAQVQVADEVAGYSVDVGQLWDGWSSSGQHATALPDSQLHEPSGLAASRVNPGVVYVHSESDVPGMVAVSTQDAQVVGRYQVAIPHQWDWEDIATGPCPTGSCIFAGDIGRSNGKPNPPDTFAVYRVAEPELSAGQTSGRLTGDWFRFRYPDGPHNAETLMVHPVTGQIYVVTREQSGVSGVYTFSASLPAPSDTTVTTLTKVTTLHLPTWTGDPTNTVAVGAYAAATAGSIHPSGDRFLIRTPYKVWEFRGTPGGGLDSAFDATPVALTPPTGEGQGEAIEYALDGSAYYTLSEREAPPFTLKRVDRR